MRVTVTNANSDGVLLITLPTGGGQAIESSTATTIDVDSGSQISFDQITISDYLEGGGTLTTMGNGFGLDIGAELIKSMKLAAMKRKDPNFVAPTKVDTTEIDSPPADEDVPMSTLHPKTDTLIRTIDADPRGTPTADDPGRE